MSLFTLFNEHGRVWLVRAFLFLLPAIFISNLCAAEADPAPTFPVRVELVEKQADLMQLQQMRIDVDAVFDGWARIYVDQGELKKLRHLGFRVTVLPDLAREEARKLREEPPPPRGTAAVPAIYHTYDTLTSELATIAANHPSITRLMSIGQSVQGRELWMMKITDNPDLDEDEPEVAYISSMHGDEVTGKELCFNLIVYLTDKYGFDSRITDLVDNTEIWIMPSMNPDGTELGQRNNANGVELNRHFPDYIDDPVNTTDGREPEAVAMILWANDQTINLSANYHGGALLVNYPYDNNAAHASVDSPTPDDLIFESTSLTYSQTNLPMYNSPSFPNGITNGAAWYAISGGMQDWFYVWYSNFHVTIEVSNTKWPPASELPTFWDDNRESMISYFERVHEGIRGIVTDSQTGLPVAATVTVQGNAYPAYTDPDAGDYHRLLYPGIYTLEFSALAYETVLVSDVQVHAGLPATRQDVALNPLPAKLKHLNHRLVGGDGVLDPGDTSDLALTLRNLGETASGVSAWLEPTGWFAEVTRTMATYPDLNPGESGESAAPHYEISVAADVPAGHKLGFAAHWSSGEISGTTEPFFLDVGAPQCDSVSATDLPQPIIDYQTTLSQLEFTSGAEISEIRVTVDISHTYIGDLDIELESPSATTVTLHNRSGGSASDIVGTYGVDLTPAESLSVLNGESPIGTWRLRVTDNAGADTGTVNSWTIEICSTVSEAATPQMRFSAISHEPEGVVLSWWSYPGLTSYRVYRSTDPSSGAAFLDVTSEDADNTDTLFTDSSVEPLVYYIVTGVGPLGEGAKGHFGE